MNADKLVVTDGGFYTYVTVYYLHDENELVIIGPPHKDEQSVVTRVPCGEVTTARKAFDNIASDPEYLNDYFGVIC